MDSLMSVALPEMTTTIDSFDQQIVKFALDHEEIMMAQIHPLGKSTQV
jgi:hypothetical protein